MPPSPTETVASVCRQACKPTLSLNPHADPLCHSVQLADTAFKQQRLKAWQPILTPATVLPTFFLIGVIFLPLGGVLLWGSNKVHDYTIDYTACEFQAPNNTFEQLPSSKYSYHLGTSESVQAPSWQFQYDPNAEVGRQEVCRINFELPVQLDAPVFMYYKRELLVSGRWWRGPG